MKKNRTMRLASCLLVLTLITTSILSGTFAKYVTSGSANDSARVAKFGVVIASSGSLFGTQYVDATGGNTPGSTNLTVSASENVVAPGTQNDTGLTIGITGTPEVKVHVDFAVTGVQDVFLAAKENLPDMTTADTADTFNNAAAYYPVVYTLKRGSTVLASGTLADIETYLEGNSITNDYAAGTNLSTAIGTLTLTWAWAFEDSKDKQDTLLGDLAAETTLAPAPNPALAAGTDYNLGTAATITVTVTQID